MLKKIGIRVIVFFFAVKLNAQNDFVLNLSLQEIFELADKQSHTQRKAEYNIKRAKSELAASRLQWAPSLSLSASVGYLGNSFLTDRNFSHAETLNMPHFSNKLAVQLTQTIYDRGMLKEIKQQRSATQLAYIQEDVQKQEIHFMLVEWYLYYLKLINLKEVYLNDKTRLEKLLSETRERYEQGTVLKSDVTNYRLKLKETELLLMKNKSQIHVVNYQLVKLLDLPEHTVIKPDDTFLTTQPEYLKPQTGRVCPEQAPLFQESRKQYELSRQKEELVKVKRWPTLFAWGENTLNGPISTALPPLNKNLNSWGVGLGLSLNISNLYKSGETIKAASFSAEMYREQAELVQDKLDTELYTVQAKLEEAFEELTIRNEYKTLASELYKVMYERYSNGMAIVTEMMDAGNELVSADVEFLNIQIELFYHYYRLKKIAGTLY